MAACEDEDFVDIAKSLVAAGADINAVADDGRLPLTCAALSGNAGLVGWLLEHGASPNPVCVFVCTRVGVCVSRCVSPLAIEPVFELSVLSFPLHTQPKHRVQAVVVLFELGAPVHA